MQPGQLSGHGDDIHGRVVGQVVERARHLIASSPVTPLARPLRAVCASGSSAQPFARCSSSPRGSSPAVASRKDSSASRALVSSLDGTTTSTVTSRSPLSPSERRRTPLPLTRNVRPFGVPGGMRTVTGMPRWDGTLISAPSAASVNVTGTVTVRLSPVLPNTLSGVTCTLTYRSPAGPPRSPGASLALSLIRWPSATPAGMRAWMVRVLIARPLPEHTGQGSSTTMPRPRQVRHGSDSANPPRFLLSCPVPLQVGQTLGTVPALAPVPRQVGHGPSPASRSATVEPSIASANESVVSVSMSVPRRGLACVPPRPPNTPPSRSPSLPPVLVRPPPPNRERASSYSLRFFSSARTLCASEISLKRSSEEALPLFASGWYFLASLR